MRRFKNKMGDGWLFREELRCFRNFMRNWDFAVRYCDFFDIFTESTNTSVEEAKEMIGRAFTQKELGGIEAIRISFCERDEIRNGARYQPQHAAEVSLTQRSRSMR